MDCTSFIYFTITVYMTITSLSEAVIIVVPYFNCVVHLFSGEEYTL